MRLPKSPFRSLHALAVLLAAISLAPAIVAGDEAPAFSVQGRFLHDPNGDRVVLRGVNAMIIYWDRLGEESFPEIAKTGANAVRIYWTTTDDATAAELDVALQNCWDHRMIPIICLWDATGKWDKLDACIAYWQRPDIVEVLKRHERHLLLNIANEAGNREVSDQAFREKYSHAIRSLRALGLSMPFIIDAAHWGRGEDYLLENGPYLLDQDPLRNLIFSWHPWDVEQPHERYRQAIDASIDKDLCLLIGEFSHLGVFYKKSIDWSFLLDYCQEKQIGWLAWVWHCCGDKTDGHSLTTDSQYGNWANDPWGRQLVLGHPHSLANTAEKTPFIRQSQP